MKIPVMRGRSFSDVDRADAPVVCVIDSRLAETFFPGQDPLGQELAMYRGYARIVGIAGTVRGTTLEESSRPVVYYPLVQVPFFQQAAALVRSPVPAGTAIREAVRRTNRSVVVYDNLSMEDRIAESLGLRRLLAFLVCVFAMICVLLATIGLNGVISQVVGERTQEIGIRMALGARPSQVLAQFVRQGLLAGTAGLLIGLLASAWAQRWITGFLYEVKPFDAATFAAASATVLAILAIAVYLPARRASRIEPQSVLRYE